MSKSISKVGQRVGSHFLHFYRSSFRLAAGEPDAARVQGRNARNTSGVGARNQSTKMKEHQASLRDAFRFAAAHPWAEAHGYGHSAATRRVTATVAPKFDEVGRAVKTQRGQNIAFVSLTLGAENMNLAQAIARG